jgi:hypothetical protein
MPTLRLATACVAGKTVSTVVKPTAATNGDASSDLNGALPWGRKQPNQQLGDA